MAKVYVDDVGTVLEVDTTIDITGAASVSIDVKKPDDTIVNWVGTVDQTTKIRYVIAVNDLDQAGEYLLQAVVTSLSGFTGRGETAKLLVHSRFR